MERNLGHDRRRRGDRRQSARAGKYERRKNTCENCQFYKPQSQIAGVCLKHQTMIRAEEFACIWFLPGASTEDSDE